MLPLSFRFTHGAGMRDKAKLLMVSLSHRLLKLLKVSLKQRHTVINRLIRGTLLPLTDYTSVLPILKVTL